MKYMKMIEGEKMFDYKFLFPFEKVPKGSRVVIYGAGEVGWEYYRQLRITQYVEIVGVIDRRAGQMEAFPARIFYPAEICDIDFDYIVLAFRADAYHKSVSHELIKIGVDENKIIYIPPRIEPKYEVVNKIDGFQKEMDIYAYERECLSIAIRLGSAIGDNIIQKKFVMALAQLEPTAKVDIYSPVSDSYLSWLYQDVPNINSFIKDAGSFYTQQCSKYDFSLQIWVFPHIDYINDEKLKKIYGNFYSKAKKLEKKIKEADMDYSMPMFNFFARSIKQGKNVYTVYDYDGEFGITDNRVDIILGDIYKNEYENLKLPPRYITVNYGNGISTENEKIIAKQWPRENFEELVQRIKRIYPALSIVQLGVTDAYNLEGVDRYILGRPLGVAAHVLKKSLVHIDIEGGLVHLATQLGTKCVVLFGPTLEKFFGYEQNINIKAGTCHDCYGMYLDHTICARHLDKPECMYSITPMMVLKKVEEYLIGCKG